MARQFLTWEHLDEAVERGVPARIAISGEPKLELMIGERGETLALLIPSLREVSLSPRRFESIGLDYIQIDGIRYIRVFTATRSLFPEFYVLISEIADMIQIEKKDPLEAVDDRLESWQALLGVISLLSSDRQTGLMGELWVLQRLIAAIGPKAVDTWTGPLCETHDFRFGDFELEVKTTRNKRRLHVINGLEQLVASPGRRLYLLSLQFAPSNGESVFSLRNLVDAVRNLLKNAPHQLALFNSFLRDRCSYNEGHREHYCTTFHLRSNPMLIHVDDTFPRLKRENLRGALGALEQRITDLQYTVDVEALGIVDNTPEFLAVLPKG
jgi:hypothetical protein